VQRVRADQEEKEETEMIEDLSDNEKDLAKALIAILNVACITPRLDMADVQRVLDALAEEWRITPGQDKT